MKPKTEANMYLSFLALAVALFLWWIYPVEGPGQVETTATSTQALFPQVQIEARAAMVYDAKEHKVLYEKDSELQWPLASLTKLMSAYTASKIIPRYHLVRISSEDLREEGDTSLHSNELWNIGKLVDYSLIVSSNDGMKAIASVAGAIIGVGSSTPEQVFVREMNRRAKEIGLTETYFLNQSGLDVSKTLSGGYGSAKDMAILLDRILKEDSHLVEATTYDKTTIKSESYIYPATNTNKAILGIPNMLASKTGYTELSGGNVVVAWNAGLDHPIIISVLGSSYDGRFIDLATLVQATLSYLVAAQANP